jgi:hypothetical protein
MSSVEIEHLHTTLETHLPTEVANEVKRMLYGNPTKLVHLKKI